MAIVVGAGTSSTNNSSSFVNSGTFTNAGVFRATAGSNSSGTDNRVDFENTGIFAILDPAIQILVTAEEGTPSTPYVTATYNDGNVVIG